MIELSICIPEPVLLEKYKEYRILFLEQYLRFKPDTFEITNTRKNFERSFTTIDDVKDFNEDTEIKIFNAQGEGISFVRPAKQEGPIVIHYTLNNLQELINIAKEAYELLQYSVAYIYDPDFIFWQSQDEISIYEAFEKSHFWLPKKYDTEFDRRVIDISKNPGRRTLVKHMWLQSSFMMFFGSFFFDYVTKDKLLAFPNAVDKEELKKDLVYIKLYDDIGLSDKKKSLEVMKQFRDWIRMDDLEKVLD